MNLPRDESALLSHPLHPANAPIVSEPDLERTVNDFLGGDGNCFTDATGRIVLTFRGQDRIGLAVKLGELSDHLANN